MRGTLAADRMTLPQLGERLKTISHELRTPPITTSEVQRRRAIWDEIFLIGKELTVRDGEQLQFDVKSAG